MYRTREKRAPALSLLRSCCQMDVVRFSARFGKPIAHQPGNRGHKTNPPVEEGHADDYVGHRLKIDPDLCVLEIEDPKGLYEFDGKIV